MIQGLARLRQEEYPEFKIRLGYLVRLCVKNQNIKTIQKNTQPTSQTNKKKLNMNANRIRREKINKEKKDVKQKETLTHHMFRQCIFLVLWLIASFRRLCRALMGSLALS